MSDWQELERKYFMHTVERIPLTLVRGEGARVWDDNGRAEQARTLIQVSNQFYTIPQVQVAQLLVENSCLDKVFFANSGAEAGEGAVKLARRYGHHHLNDAYEVITATGSFHGRTLTMVAATGQAKHQKPYHPLPAGFVNVAYNDVAAIKAVTTEKTCAVMLEPLQGEGGVNLPDADYLKRVREWCDDEGLLLILDEVQTGIGRLGTLFGYELYGVEPDVITLAKGLGSGVPIGAIMAKDSAAVFVPGEHGSTFGGNPLVCAAAHATLKFILDNDVLSQVKQVGEYLREKLEGLKSKFPFITEVRGCGLLMALEFDREVAADVLKACLERGLLVNRVKPTALRFMPPLTIGSSEVDEAINILGEALTGV
jgi:acetylornithine/succinyldiaminopimelate/putrescine aminotransferase